MNLVFMNRLEKKADDRLQSGRVSIGEEQGVWHVVWEEPRGDGKLEPFFWYEGSRWDDMLVAFRLGLQHKRREGYVPLIDDVGGGAASPRSARIPALQFYGEAHRREELFQELRKWRFEKSNRDGKTPFILATNRTLEMISAFVPHTPEELKQIPGMSGNKIADFGEDILQLTRAHEQPRPFPLDWVETEVAPLDLAQWQNAQQEAKVRAAVQKQAGKRKLLEGISQGQDLGRLEKELGLPRRDLLNWVEELDKEGYDVEPLLETELSAVGEAERLAAEQAMREEGTRYLKPIFNRVYDKDKLTSADANTAYEWLRLLRIRVRGLEESGGTPAAAADQAGLDYQPSDEGGGVYGGAAGLEEEVGEIPFENAG